MSATLGAACVALHALFTTALAGEETVRVVDGPQVTSDAANEWLFVGYDADDLDENSEGASAEQSWMAFARTKQEAGEVISAIVVRSGEANVVPTLRTRALVLLGLCEDAVRAEPTLGGLAMQAWVSDVRFIPMASQAGSKARVVFTTSYQAQI